MKIRSWRERIVNTGFVTDSMRTVAMQTQINDLQAALATIENETIEQCAVRGRIAQLDNKDVYDEIRALKKEGA